MRKGINQFSFPDNVPLKQCFREARRMGYVAFEVCMTLDDPSIGSDWSVAGDLGIDNYVNPMLNTASSDAELMELAKLARDEGVEISSIASVVPFMTYPLTSPKLKVRRKSEDFLARMIESADILGADTVLVIPGGALPDVSYLSTYDWAQEALGRLAVKAEEHEVDLALENVWNHFLYSPLEIVRFIDEIGSNRVGVYYDIANSLILGYPQQWIRLFDHRLKKIHIKDFRLSVGNITGFTNVLDGDVDWPAVAIALEEIGYKGDLIVELTPPAKHYFLQTLQQASDAMDLIFGENLQNGGI